MRRLATVMLAFAAVFVFMVSSAEAGRRYVRRSVVRYGPHPPVVVRTPVVVHPAVVPHVHPPFYPVVPHVSTRVVYPRVIHYGPVYTVPSYGVYYRSKIHVGTPGVRVHIGY